MKPPTLTVKYTKLQSPYEVISASLENFCETNVSKETAFFQRTKKTPITSASSLISGDDVGRSRLVTLLQLDIVEGVNRHAIKFFSECNTVL